MGFFKRIFGGDPVKRRTLRLLKKELAAARIDLYKIKHDTILPALAKLLFELYRLTYPFKQFIPLDAASGRFPPSFETNFVLVFHTERAREIYDELSEENLKKIVMKDGIKKATPQIEELLNSYFDYFDSETKNRINSIFSNFLNFAHFSHFDFYPLLREFDPGLEEANFLKKPSFSAAEGALLRADLYKLHKLLFGFEVDEKFDRGIEIFSQLKGIEVISKGNLSRLKRMVINLQKNSYTSLVIRAIDRSLEPLLIDKPQRVDIFTAFSFRVKGNVYKFVGSMKKTMTEEVVSSIVSQLFDGNVTGRVKNYNESINEQFKSNGLTLFEYVRPLNYTKAFSTDKYKVFISKLVNELIISGIFMNKSVLTSLSNSYYTLNSHIQEIVELDNSLDIDGDSGKAITRMLSMLKKDKGVKDSLERLINSTNKRAKLIIDEQIVNLKEMAYSLKSILEDYKKTPNRIVTNIKKIRPGSNKQFIDELIQAYKDIYLFLKLIKNYVSISVNRSTVEKQKKILKP